jgi:hypothetical protein
MPGKVRNIKPQYAQWIPVILGSPMDMVSRRQLVHKYEVNREIKYWSTWYLLKTFTTSSYIQHWIKQKNFLLTFLQMNECTFRAHLKWLSDKTLLTVDKKSKTIRMASYEHAAEVMDIYYEGTYTIQYDHTRKQLDHYGRPVAPKQSFQYLLRAEEIERRKEISLNALIRKLEENPKLLNDLIFLMTKEGCDINRVHTDPKYFQERLLELQKKYFKQGSDLLAYVFTLRADINRGVKKIQQHHGYKSQQSVSYMKRRMFKLGIIEVQKFCIKSNARSRIYIPDEESGGEREGYKWLKGEKRTALFLCDQIEAKYETDLFTIRQNSVRQTA